MYAVKDCYTKLKHHRIKDQSIYILDVPSRIPVSNNREVDAFLVFDQFIAHLSIIGDVCSSWNKTYSIRFKILNVLKL